MTTDQKLPISVVIPHIRSRKMFFESVCKPSIVAQDVAQIIVVDGDLVGPQVARNKGAAEASQPYLYFADDDAILYQGSLRTLYYALEHDMGATFAYGDHDTVDHAGPYKGTFIAGPFDPARLRRESYISTMTLMRREAFIPWDVNIRRMQDWDFWLTMVEKGHRGVYVGRPLFELHAIDKGIGKTWATYDWLRIVREKHGIPEPTV